MLENGFCGLSIWLVSVAECHIGFRNGEANWVWGRDDRNLGDSSMLNNHRFQLKWRQAVVGGLEDIISSSAVVDIAIFVTLSDIAGVSIAFTEDYYHTGDNAERDEDGYIYYIGRADDVFKASDYRLSP